MSHRITVKSSIKDREVLGEVLTAKGIQYSESNGVFHMSSGSLRHASIDTNTGDITGDTDYGSHNTLGQIRQDYGEAVARKQCLIEGVEIQDRQVVSIDGQSVVRLVCQKMFVG